MRAALPLHICNIYVKPPPPPRINPLLMNWMLYDPKLSSLLYCRYSFSPNIGLFALENSQKTKGVGESNSETVRSFTIIVIPFGEIHTQTIIKRRSKKSPLPYAPSAIGGSEKIVNYFTFQCSGRKGLPYISPSRKFWRRAQKEQESRVDFYRRNSEIDFGDSTTRQETLAPYMNGMGWGMLVWILLCGRVIHFFCLFWANSSISSFFLFLFFISVEPCDWGSEDKVGFIEKVLPALRSWIQCHLPVLFSLMKRPRGVDSKGKPPNLPESSRYTSPPWISLARLCLLSVYPIYVCSNICLWFFAFHQEAVNINNARRCFALL